MRRNVRLSIQKINSKLKPKARRPENVMPGVLELTIRVKPEIFKTINLILKNLTHTFNKSKGKNILSIQEEETLLSD